MFKQISALTAMSLKGIPDRPLAALVTIFAVAAMVAVMTSLLAMGAGLSESSAGKIGPDMAVVLTRGAANDYMGSIPRDAISVVAEAPQVMKDVAGRPMVTPAVGLQVNAVRKDTREEANVDLVGIPADRFGDQSFGNRITKGRLFKPGLRELVAGRVAANRYDHLQVGDTITLRGSEWKVVGEFAADGSFAEGSVYGDADTVMSAFDRNAYQQIEVRLNSPADFASFKSAIEGDPRVSLDVKPFRQFIADRMSQLTSVINFVGYFVGTVMALGAFFGILNTMHAAIDARRREFATLRAVGFGRTGILAALTIESLLLSLPGALLGVAMAWLLFDGHLGQAADLTFPIAVTPGIAVIGGVFTLVIGVIGGLIPAIMAARQPIASSLRAT